jgi:3-isopropylmalate/(R)-2-methylmalate dehydratase large subunit
VRRPERTFATIDHSIPTRKPIFPMADQVAARQVSLLESNCREHGIMTFGVDSEERGIVHVIGPELGMTQPGKTIVCGDSHTSTHGAFGALAFGIGTSEVEQVLATQSLLQRAPRTFRVTVDGAPRPGVVAKDVILALIAKIGIGGATGTVIEYAGSTIRGFDMEARMTICNMSIEGGARAGLVAPDDATFDYLHGRPFAPKDAAWDAAVLRWRALASDEEATFDHQVTLDGSTVEPMITWGTNPAMAMAVGAPIPDLARVTDAKERESYAKAQAYMKLENGKPLLGHPVQVVFIGSCTNGRISDLREAARILRGRKVSAGVRALVVPGSFRVKREAEAEGLAEVFREAGCQWREPGCSMCIAMNGDMLRPGEFSISTSNRNFEGRQGPGSHTFLASPLTAAASAIAGVVCDARSLA